MNVEFDQNIEEVSKPKRKVAKKMVVKAKAPKGKVKAKAKVKKVAKPKPKKYSVKGSFVVSPEGLVLSKTKAITNVARGRKDKSGEYTVTFVVKVK